MRTVILVLKPLIHLVDSPLRTIDLRLGTLEDPQVLTKAIPVAREVRWDEDLLHQGM